MVKVTIIGDILADIECCDGCTNVYPGGSGLVAWHMASLGHSTTLVTSTCGDALSDIVVESLRTRGVVVIELPDETHERLPSRIRLHKNEKFRMSRIGAWDKGVNSSRIRLDIDDDSRFVVYSYYGAGVSQTVELVKNIHAYTIVDPHKCTWEFPESELAIPSGTDLGISYKQVLSAPKSYLRKALKRCNTQAIALTYGNQGLFYYDMRCCFPVYMYYSEARIRDSSGCGDLFLSNLVADVDKMVDTYDLVRDAVISTNAQLNKNKYARPGVGNCRCRSEDQETKDYSDASLLKLERVAVAGCFDCLHDGHISLLRRAKRLSHWVLVVLDDDSRISRTKGTSRPIVALSKRIAALRQTGLVNEVEVMSDDTSLDDILTRHSIDLLVKGSEYRSGFREWETLKDNWEVLAVESFSQTRTTNLLHEKMRSK